MCLFISMRWIRGSILDLIISHPLNSMTSIFGVMILLGSIMTLGCPGLEAPLRSRGSCSSSTVSSWSTSSTTRPGSDRAGLGSLLITSCSSFGIRREKLCILNHPVHGTDVIFQANVRGPNCFNVKWVTKQLYLSRYSLDLFISPVAMSELQHNLPQCYKCDRKKTYYSLFERTHLFAEFRLWWLSWFPLRCFHVSGLNLLREISPYAGRGRERRRVGTALTALPRSQNFSAAERKQNALQLLQ